MGEYVFCLICVGVIGAVAAMLAHEGTKSTLRLALGVLTLAVAVIPIGALTADMLEEGINLPEPPDYSDSGGYLEVAEEAFCRGVSLAIAERFGTDEEHLYVSCRGFSLQNMTAESIYVRISNAPSVDYRAVKEYVRENFTKGGECRVESVI